MRAALRDVPRRPLRVRRRARLRRPASGAADARPASWSRCAIDGEDVTFDFTGTDAQRPGNVNAVEAVTVSAVAFAIRAVTDPTLPANGGTLRPVHVDRAAGHGGRRACRRSRWAPATWR